MWHKFTLVYSWFVWFSTFLLPDIPIIMRFRGWLYSIVMPKAGKNFQVSNGARLYSLSNILVGDDVFFATNIVVNAGAKITFESQVMLGIGVVIVSGNHTIENGSYRFGKMQRKPIVIGFGAWVGANSTIVAGANVPSGSLIAANSVVSKPLTLSGIYGGVPANLIKLTNSVSP